MKNDTNKSDSLKSGNVYYSRHFRDDVFLLAACGVHRRNIDIRVKRLCFSELNYDAPLPLVSV